MEKEKSIYIVDDQADQRFILQKLFTMSFPQCRLYLFGNGQDLLDKLPELTERPSLILMDYHMPILDGYQTLRRLKQDPAYDLIPVVMMSAEANRTEIQACYRAGANSFLRKQLDFQLQLEMVSKIGQYWLQTNLDA